MAPRTRTEDEVRTSHVIDALEKCRARALRQVNDDMPLLETALWALDHERPHVTQEYVERVLDHMHELRGFLMAQHKEVIAMSTRTTQ